MAADRFSFNKSFEHVQNKFVGTGHSDMTKWEWATNQHRDTLASHIGHYDILSYIAVAQNDSIGRVRYQLLEKMLQPCGPPPVKDDDEGPDA
ncbi:splicing factor 3B subunit 5/RDS3 complex subunit 10 [Ochromonadaceae sp. CCMP2298]|nr:splicing factor 3B subunit 5/RDS3 complex subunit 10 [Ochromonadaceae sp. CCMP2298]|mmetsp:Transcript_31241/g.68896  ORF Transcript_31241/g.68896 Transcript_31241/m.68896 type:complete len:92 (-) Transcript_31241:166-441(-)|eukprot:CAMPEP_0173194218 /NCGR_PEP_ID=MMETSP1141-20130122/14390_1 /TAXON_ID=483371 /ORGANISM="non described non described, Strain CCMP2298" /LENGTH=91 /DNA_ID=CAMNT_0014118637 /DNA_START=33 /DNA_END=308 /DNA_ORIENTATION=-